MTVRIIEVKILERWDEEHWEPVSIYRGGELYAHLLLRTCATSPTKRRYRIAGYVRDGECAAPKLLAACKNALESLRAWNTIGLYGKDAKLARETYEGSPEIQMLVKAITEAEQEKESHE